MRAALRQKLLEAIASGLDVEAACAANGVPLKVAQGDAAFMASIPDSYRLGSAKLRARVLGFALEAGDAKTLAQMLEQREAAQAAMTAAANAARDESSSIEQFRKELHDEVERHRAAMIPQCTHCEAPCQICAAARAAEAAQKKADREAVQKARAGPEQPSLRSLAVLDEIEPLPRHRAPVRLEPPPPPRRSYSRLPKALAPGSPWATDASDEYPL